VQRFVDEGPVPTFDSDSYFTELVRYIHLNPLRVELVEDLKELEKYPYHGHGTARRQGSNLDLSTYPREILKPLSDLQFSLDLFPDRSAIAVHQTLIQTSKPLGDHALLKPAVSMQ